MSKTNEQGLIAIACTSGLFIVKYLNNNQMRTISHLLVGNRLESVNFVKDTTLVLGYSGNVILFDFRNKKILGKIKNPTNDVPLRLISLKNGTALNNVKHLK